MKVKKRRQRLTPVLQRPIHQLDTSIKLTNIGVDCLQQVLSDFQLEDLSIVAGVNQQFKEAANYVFISKYSQKIEIKRNTHRYLKPLERYNVTGGIMILSDKKIILKVLRCFGHSITDINFNYQLNSRFDEDMEKFQRVYDKIISYINIYCADSLKSMSIDPVTVGFEALCTKPFSKVETVKLYVATLDVLSLNRLFPQMQSLNFEWHWRPLTRDAPPITMPEQYPHLKHLRFGYNKQSNLVDSFFKKTLQMNTQLQSLNVVAKRSFYSQLRAIQLPNVENFSFRDFDICVTRGTTIPFKLDKLRDCILYGIDKQNATKHYNFIKRHTSIEKLTFVSGSVFDDMENGFLSKIKSLNTHTSLREIRLKCSREFPIEYVMKYIVDFGTLKYFSFFCSSSDDDINRCCGDSWKCVHEDCCRQVFKHLRPPPEYPFVKLTRNM